MDALQSILGYWWVFVILLLLVGYKLVLRLAFGMVIIAEDEIGIVNKKFRLFGSNRTLPDGKIVALNGEAGVQADTLAPGLHWGLWPWQYEVMRQKFLTVPQGQVGFVEARDGEAVNNGRLLAKGVDCDSFQSARMFLTNGGQRGPQSGLILPGTYRINTALFSVEVEDAIDVPKDQIGIVTTKDGKQLPKGEIAGHEVPGHNTFQDVEAFITAGGFRGPQEQVMLPGRYYVNPKFAEVRMVPFTDVPIAHVGVVIAYVGAAGNDVTGETFKHGNLVKKGEKGVWVEPLDPGKYPINPVTHHVEIVPTANVVLNWATGKNEAHNLDKNLSTITVRSADGFTFNLDVSQIIHIPRNDAPKVIARFGSVANLVTQVLEPTIGNYFRNAAQKSDAISFLKERTERQSEAKQAISAALTEYNVGAVDTLIGDINPPEALMKTLTDRKIAEQEQVTYETQRQAEIVRKELAQATAMADTQPKVVNAEREVQIAGFTAEAKIKTAEGDARSKTINAEADATVLITVGEAEGKKITAVGQAEAEVLKRKGEAIDPRNYAAIQIAESLSNSTVPIVPGITVGGGNGTGGGTLTEVLIANLLRDSLKGVPAESGGMK